MNGIIALCHFCENHGPSVMFCTQVFHASRPIQLEASKLFEATPCSESDDEDTSACEKECQKDQPSLIYEKLGKMSVSSEEQSSLNTALPKVDVKCEACRSLPPGISGYSSKDTDADVTYISRQYPLNQQVFSMVRQACVRSLSSEVSPGRDGPAPIFFGDEEGGYVLCHTFILKDSKYSRGFQRRYSFIIVMMDKIYLLNSWPFLVKHLRGIIEELQTKAMQVYEAEQGKSPVRNPHLAHKNFPHIRSMTPLKPARSLIDLTGDKLIFRKLHQTFTWLLKAGGNRLTEKLLEGPPTEDSVIDIEKQEETEEGFILLSSVKDVDGNQSDDVSSDSSDTDTDQPCLVFRNLRHLLKALGYTQFHKLAHNTIMGNQVIIRGAQRKIVRSAIDCLKTLLPKGCCKTIYYSKTHEDAWKCNFLGLAPSAELPQHIEHYVAMNIYEPRQVQNDSDAEDAIQALIGSDFMGYTFTVDSPTVLPEKGPVILSKMEYALMNDNLADSVVDQCLICLKEECMNKVKVLFKFTKAGGCRSEDDTKELLRIVGAQPEDKVVLQFWRTGLSVQYRHHMVTSAITNK